MTAFSPLLGALAAAALLLAASSSARAAGKPPPAPTAEKPSAAADIARARALMKTGRDEEALAILRPLVRRGTVHADALFLIGVAAIGASHKPGISEGSARRAAGRGHRGAAQAADRPSGPRPGAPRARPRLLPQGRGRAGERAFRAGAGRQSPRRRGAQRGPLPSPRSAPASAGPSASARRSRPTATSPRGRASAPSSSTPRSGGCPSLGRGTSPNRESGSRCGPAASTSTR